MLVMENITKVKRCLLNKFSFSKQSSFQNLLFVPLVSNSKNNVMLFHCG